MSFWKFLKRLGRFLPKRSATVVVLAAAILLGTTQQVGEQRGPVSAHHAETCEAESTVRYVLCIALQSVIAELFDAIKESLNHRNVSERAGRDFCAKLEDYLNERSIGEDRLDERQEQLKACKRAMEAERYGATGLRR